MLLAAAAVVSVKLFVMTANGVAITDYPSMARCEQARTELLKRVLEEAKKDVPKGYRLVAPPTVTAMCIAS
jgi:hypothetical protein